MAGTCVGGEGACGVGAVVGDFKLILQVSGISALFGVCSCWSLELGWIGIGAERMLKFISSDMCCGWYFECNCSAEVGGSCCLEAFLGCKWCGLDWLGLGDGCCSRGKGSYSICMHLYLSLWLQGWLGFGRCSRGSAALKWTRQSKHSARMNTMYQDFAIGLLAPWQTAGMQLLKRRKHVVTSTWRQSRLHIPQRICGWKWNWAGTTRKLLHRLMNICNIGPRTWYTKTSSASPRLCNTWYGSKSCRLKLDPNWFPSSGSKLSGPLKADCSCLLPFVNELLIECGLNCRIALGMLLFIVNLVDCMVLLHRFNSWSKYFASLLNNKWTI